MTAMDAANAGDNEVFLRGRLAAEPEIRTLPSGDEIVTFRLTVPRSDPGAGRARVDSIDCAAGLVRVRRCLERAEPGDQLEVSGSLHRRFWRTEITVSLPRIKPSAAGFPPVVEVSDAQYVQALAALRLALPDTGIVLSTREPAALRDGLARIAVTTMSAGSSTEPGGYGDPGQAQEQFAISDERSPAEVAAMLTAAGYEPVWKDWDASLILND